MYCLEEKNREKESKRDGDPTLKIIRKKKRTYCLSPIFLYYPLMADNARTLQRLLSLFIFFTSPL